MKSDKFILFQKVWNSWQIFCTINLQVATIYCNCWESTYKKHWVKSCGLLGNIHSCLLRILSLKVLIFKCYTIIFFLCKVLFFSTNIGLCILIIKSSKLNSKFQILKGLLVFTPFSPADILQIKMSSNVVICFSVSIFFPHSTVQLYLTILHPAAIWFLLTNHPPHCDDAF